MPSFNAHNIIASSQQAGQRLDNFLFTQIKGVPKSHIYSIIRRGEVRVNSKRTKPSYKIHPADQVRIPPIRKSAPRTQIPTPELCALIDDAILYEDERIIVLNKPAQIAVHGGVKQEHGIIETLRYLKDEPHLRMAHRLDIATTGCLLITRQIDILRKVHSLWHHKDCRKIYRLIVQGRWPYQEKLVESQLRKVRKSGEYIMENLDTEDKSSGRYAATLFSLLRHGNGISLLTAELITGRTHQIRRHCSDLGYPIIGDHKYAYIAEQSFKRSAKLALHAYQLSLAIGTKQTTFTAPCPPFFNTLINND